jgi:hypothetical protein
VIDDDGAVPGAKVRITPDPMTAYNRFRRRTVRTDQVGHFSAKGIAPGKYQVSAKLRLSDDNNSPRSEPQSVTLSENDEQSIQLKLVKAEQ